jgi:hypothetical protein
MPVTVQRGDAIRVLKALGFKVVEKLDNGKLARRLAGLKGTSNIEEKVKQLDDDDAKVADTVLDDKDGKVTVEGDDTTPKGKKSKTPKPGKNGAAKTKPGEKGGVEVDWAGMRLGTSAAAINKVIDAKKAKTAKQIHEDCGVETPLSRIHGHLRKLSDRGMVEKKGEGWVRKAGKKVK